MLICNRLTSPTLYTPLRLPQKPVTP